MYKIALIIVIGTCAIIDGRRYSIVLDSDPGDTGASVVYSTKRVTQQLHNVLKSSSDSNFIYSPFSITALLSMLSAGANKNTLKEIQRVLELSNNQNLYSSFRSLNKKLKISSSGNTTFVSSNRIYVHEDFKLANEFKEILSKNFAAPPQGISFSSAGANREINGVVASDTNNKIPQLISPGVLTNNTRLVALNAVYFKGEWQNEFQGRATQEREFFKHGKVSTRIPMMITEDFFRVAEIKELDAKAVVLPYQKSEFDMILLLPNQRNGLSDLESKIATIPDALEQVFHSVTQKQSKNIVLHLPKFKVESKTDLREPLSQLGIREAFEEFEADFSKIAGPNEPLYLSKILQKAFLQVDEAGSEAGAATYAVLFTPLSIGPPIEETIKFDHPFMGLIRHIETNLILFVFRKVE